MTTRKALSLLKVDLNTDNRKETTIIEKQIDLSDKHVQRRIKLKPIDYHRLWINIDKIDKALVIDNDENLIRIKSGVKEGAAVEKLRAKNGNIEYDVIFNPNVIEDYKNYKAPIPKAKIEFSLWGQASRNEPDDLIGKYEQEIHLSRCESTVEIDVEIENNSFPMMSKNSLDHCLLGHAIIKVKSKKVFCHPIDLRLHCKIEGTGQLPTGYFGKLDEIDFQGAQSTSKKDKDYLIYQDKNENTFKVLNFSQKPREAIDIRELPPDNEINIPIYLDISLQKGCSYDSLKLIIGGKSRFNLLQQDIEKKSKPFRINTCHLVEISS